MLSIIIINYGFLLIFAPSTESAIRIWETQQCLGSVTNRLTCVHKSTWFQCWHPHNWLFQSDQPIHVHPFLLGFEDKSWQNAKVESTCRSNRSVGSLRVWSNKHKRSEVFITSRNSDKSPQTRFCSWCHLPRAAFRTRLGTTVLARVLRRRPSVFSCIFPRGLAAFQAAIATAFLIQMRSKVPCHFGPRKHVFTLTISFYIRIYHIF